MYGSGPVDQPRQQPTYRAEEFAESIGISGVPSPALFELGVRYYRVGLWDTDKGRGSVAALAAERVAAWERYGMRPMVLVDSLRDQPAQTLDMIKQHPPGLIAQIEGANEVNNKFPPQVLNTRYGGKTDEAGGTAFMDDFVKLLRADEATRDIPVVSFTAIFTDYRLAKPHASFDFANMHSYQGNNAPSASLESNVTRFNNVLPVGAVIKPFVPSECGYNVEEDKANHTGITGSVRAQARNIPMLMAEYFRHGIPRTYLFALHNADGYGLLESDNKTRRPSYYAFKSLIAAVNDATWNPKTKKWEGGKDFTPRTLLFDMPGAAPSVHTLVLQKQDGEYNVLIWNEVENYDGATKRDRANAPVPVTIRFQTKVQNAATLLTQNDAGTHDSAPVEVKDGEVRLQVPSAVSILRLRPGSDAAPAPLAAPEQLAGNATENEANLKWQPVTGATGYFVFRNGWHLATTAADDDETVYADNSSWLRPGLGYTYEVQAYSAAGATSARSRVVVQTQAKFPDLVATDIATEPAAPRPGDRVRFKAKVRNAGDGATPNKIPIGATWLLGDKVIGWSTPAGPIQPGREWTLTSDSGPTGGEWTAEAGTRLLTCVLDDINRLPGEPKENNVSDRTFVVGEPTAGRLDGSTQAALGSVDLSTEGTLDWVHWGLVDKASINRKDGANLIDAELIKQGEGFHDRTGGCPVSIRWTDGTPTAAATDVHAGLWWNNVGTSQRFGAPADTTDRELKVYVAGIEGAGGTFTATLSDGSAPPYVSRTWNGNAGQGDWAAVPGSFSAVYTVRYRAASAKQKLIVEWKLSSEPNQFLGQARLQAATLSVAK